MDNWTKLQRCLYWLGMVIMAGGASVFFFISEMPLFAVIFGLVALFFTVGGIYNEFSPKGRKIAFIIVAIILSIGIIFFISQRPSDTSTHWDDLSEEEKEYYRENGETIMEMQEWADDN